MAATGRLRRERAIANNDVYPDDEQVFAALQLTPFASIRAVILGQDPYHRPGQAHGLAFSVSPGVSQPPSLRNIIAELERDLGNTAPAGGSLVPWAQHGVLLLNTALTVRRGAPGSHRHTAWEEVTDEIIKAVAAKPDPIVILLWGNPARAKRALINPDRHIVLHSSHPSPLSARRGFIGSSPFRRSNEELAQRGLAPINWDLDQR